MTETSSHDSRVYVTWTEADFYPAKDRQYDSIPQNCCGIFLSLQQQQPKPVKARSNWYFRQRENFETIDPEANIYHWLIVKYLNNRKNLKKKCGESS